jgi:hypothetical protein
MESFRPRLVFALDATGSRQPTWDNACELQASMFAAAGDHIEVQLVFYRGDECRASKWLDSRSLAAATRKINCIRGQTQIGKVLRHTLKEAERGPGRVKGLVFVGDEVEEGPQELRELYELARMLGVKQIPAFMFQEGDDGDVWLVFSEIAKLSGGVFCQFGTDSAKQLKALLRALVASGESPC